MRTARQSRLIRHEEPRPVRLQDRDVWLLEALAKMRFLTTSQVARLAFGGSRSAANKRLRKLLDGGLIRTWVRDLAADNVYGLARGGARLVAEGCDDGAAAATAPRGLDGNLNHLLAINDVRLALALGLGKVEGELAWWRSDWELRSSLRERFVPDSLFAIQWPTGEQVFALELDNEARSRRAFLKKLVRYVAHQSGGRGFYGVRNFLTLVVGRQVSWVERYRAMAGASPSAWHVWFTTLDSLQAEGVEGAIWASPEGTILSLRELGSLPYGKEVLEEEGDTLSGSYEMAGSADISR